MQIASALMRALFGAMFLSGFLIAMPAMATKLDDATCLTCHDSGKGKLEMPGAAGGTHELRAVSSAKFKKSVHAALTCVSCHTDIVDSKAGHQRVSGVAPPDCAQCHETLWQAARRENTAKDKPRLGVVVENILAYKKSFHARVNKEDPNRVNATCTDCHDTHRFNVPARGTTERTEWHLAVPQVCGEKCHNDELDEFNDSVHGKQISEKHNLKSAVCSDCHTTHGIGNTSANPVKLAITAECGSCHEDNYKTYKDTYHGKINTLGHAYTAKCYDCHGSHGILDVKNPASKVHPNNVMKTCRTCHNGKKDLPDAPPGFSSFQPHGHAGDFKRYPEIWIANQIMTQLLLGTFGFFWLHTLLWFYREFKERRQRRGQAHINTATLDELPPKLHGKHFKRFSRTWRIAHITFALSLMLLTLTGIPLFFPAAPWAEPLMILLGGPHTAGIIHRINAVIFGGVFFWHLFYIGIKLARDWKNFKTFGPNSLVPGWQDLKDIVAMFKWFLGKGPRPIFDRWTYWEKFDYWAPFWGVTIIGVSGLIMWLPQLAAQYLPGWVFNVAAIFHSEEAFLAVVFLFTVHFFNNHFRPDKFPLDIVMFTGTVSLEEYRHEHPLEYQRLLASGELEKHLVDAPSPSATTASKILGFTLIVIGLILLTLVGVGFFTSW
ncbi:MAG: cytochrome c3 family protein [Propionivibrio sp.]|nr:cytochrome c3 family protein [Propionivibrio sp.]